MITMFSFKQALAQTLKQLEVLPIKDRKYQFKIESLQSIDWSSLGSEGRIFDVGLKVLSEEQSSEFCLQAMEMIEELVAQKAIGSSNKFYLVKAEIQSSSLDFAIKENLWLGMMKIRFWVKATH